MTDTGVQGEARVGGVERGQDDPSDRAGDGVHPVQIGLWKKEIKEQARQLFAGKRDPKPVAEHADPEALHSEIGKLKMELD